ncbi:hypothetical protein [Cesiribacter andamanensis]|uniref:hypothetical protein n=1 Tax=Cesiribacter andamanensis TaxID=649507 RepID=UPI001F3FDC68|nr:hypothetical protein [Cesiribacter andamanensis]
MPGTQQQGAKLLRRKGLPVGARNLPGKGYGDAQKLIALAIAARLRLKEFGIGRAFSGLMRWRRACCTWARGVLGVFMG